MVVYSNSYRILQPFSERLITAKCWRRRGGKILKIHGTTQFFLNTLLKIKLTLMLFASSQPDFTTIIFEAISTDYLYRASKTLLSLYLDTKKKSSKNTSNYYFECIIIFHC